MQIISFINMKGGVGKTTLTVNVACGLAYLHKKNVLVVDADPQFNASQYLMEDEDYLKHVEDSNKGTLLDIFVPRRPGSVNTVRGTSKPIDRSKMALADCTCNIFDGGPGQGNLDLIPSRIGLMEIETSKRGTEMKLRTYLREKAQAYDYVLIDCPPTISIFTQAAILASDKYLVPVKPDPLSVVGLPLLERALEETTEDAGETPESVGMVFTLVRGQLPARMREVMAELRERRKDQVFTNFLSEAKEVAESVEAHEPVFRHAPGSKVADQIAHITKEFVQRTSGG